MNADDRRDSPNYLNKPLREYKILRVVKAVRKTLYGIDLVIITPAERSYRYTVWSTQEVDGVVKPREDIGTLLRSEMRQLVTIGKLVVPNKEYLLYE